MAVPKKGRVEAWLAVEKRLGPRPLGPRLGLGEGSKGFGCGGVGGRGTAPELVWWTGGGRAGRRGWMAVRAWFQKMARVPEAPRP